MCPRSASGVGGTPRRPLSIAARTETITRCRKTAAGHLRPSKTEDDEIRSRGEAGACGHDRRTARKSDTRNSPIALVASRRRQPSVDTRADNYSSDTITAVQAYPALTSRAPSVWFVSQAVQAGSLSVPSGGSRRSRSARSQSSRSAPGSAPRAS